MAWYDRDSLVTMAFAPYYSTMIIAFLVAILLPILLHIFVYRPVMKTSTPRFTLLGPSGSGKTTLVAQFEGGELSPTHTSISPITVEATLPSSVALSSSKYRSENDVQPGKKILLTDTPGHSKLRHLALETLVSSKSKPTTGVIFVIDASAIGSDGSSSGVKLTETATYLHDALLQLQKQDLQSKSKGKSMPFLIAANKMDLFTALPEKMVKTSLEKEIMKLRETKSKGIASITQSTSAEGLNFGTGNTEEDDDERNVLAGDASVEFKFEQLDEWGIDVTVLGGSVVEGEKGVDKWWQWIGELL